MEIKLTCEEVESIIQNHAVSMLSQYAIAEFGPDPVVKLETKNYYGYDITITRKPEPDADRIDSEGEGK